jgi:hypothetical protein
MYHRSRLKSVIRALGSHACGSNAAEFGVKEFDQPAGGLMVAVAKPRHELGNRIGLKSG